MPSGTYDVVIVGNYTKDTIVSPAGTKVVDGGGFNYAAHVTAMAGLRTAAVTRLSRSDERVVEALRQIGVTVFSTYTEHSTCLRLWYQNADLDDRVLSITESAGAFGVDEVRGLRGRAMIVTGSVRGEVGLEVLDELRLNGGMLAADVQAFLRIVSPQGTLIYADWPEKEKVLSRIAVLKADSAEAEILTGTTDMRQAAMVLADFGPREIVLTRRDGVLVYTGGRIYEAPFRPRKLVGRSGRGDTCIGAYVAARLSAGPREATLWAAAATSLKLEADGPIQRNRHEVKEMIHELAAHM